MSDRVNDDKLLERLLAGDTPAGQADLEALSGALVEYRSAALVAAPRPSATLQRRLDAPVGAGISAAAGDAAAEPTTGRKSVFEWIAGLGLAAKIAAGGGVLALGLTGVGAAGALPGPLQDGFDSVVETVVPLEDEAPVTDEELVDEGDETTDDGTETELPVGSDEFSKWVSENAQDPEKVGSEFGEQVSEQARELRDEKAAERAGGPDKGETDGKTDGDVEGETDGEGDDSGTENPERVKPAEKGGDRGGNENRGGGRP